jgi:hypothetical protein
VRPLPRFQAQTTFQLCARFLRSSSNLIQPQPCWWQFLDVVAGIRLVMLEFLLSDGYQPSRGDSVVSGVVKIPLMLSRMSGSASSLGARVASQLQFASLRPQFTNLFTLSFGNTGQSALRS